MKKQNGIKQLPNRNEILKIQIVMVPNIFSVISRLYEMFTEEIPISDKQMTVMFSRIIGIVRHMEISREMDTTKFYNILKKIIHQTEKRIWIKLVEPDNYEPHTDGTIF